MSCLVWKWKLAQNEKQERVVPVERRFTICWRIGRGGRRARKCERTVELDRNLLEGCSLHRPFPSRSPRQPSSQESTTHPPYMLIGSPSGPHRPALDRPQGSLSDFTIIYSEYFFIFLPLLLFFLDRPQGSLSDLTIIYSEYLFIIIIISFIAFIFHFIILYILRAVIVHAFQRGIVPSRSSW